MPLLQQSNKHGRQVLFFPQDKQKFVTTILKVLVGGGERAHVGCVEHEKQAVKGIPREKVQIATKFGNVISADGQWGVRGDPEWVRESCEGSLKRLGVDYIDLYYQHRLDPKVPIEITVRSMQLPASRSLSSCTDFH